MLTIITSIWFLIFVTLYLVFPDHRREMIWAGVLSVPLMLLWSVANYSTNESYMVALYALGLRLIFGFLFAGTAAVVHELFLYKYMKLPTHPHRAKLVQLLLGPLAFLVSVLVFQWSAIWSLFIGFVVEVLVLTYHRKELLWEAIVSGLFLAGIYSAIFITISRLAPVSGVSVWVSTFSGLDILGLPIEEILLVFGYGMLWGPLYEGVKREKKSS